MTCAIQPLPSVIAIGWRTNCECGDVGIRSERRQTVCAETFRMDNAARRRSGLRVSNTAFLGWGRKLRALVLKFICAVIAAAAFAGVLWSLSATTSARPIAPAPPEEASMKPAPDGLGPISSALVPERSESRKFRMLTNDALTPSAGVFGAFVSDARLLWESAQIQDW